MSIQTSKMDYSQTIPDFLHHYLDSSDGGWLALFQLKLHARSRWENNRVGGWLRGRLEVTGDKKTIIYREARRVKPT